MRYTEWSLDDEIAVIFFKSYLSLYCNDTHIQLKHLHTIQIYTYHLEFVQFIPISLVTLYIF